MGSQKTCALCPLCVGLQDFSTAGAVHGVETVWQSKYWKKNPTPPPTHPHTGLAFPINQQSLNTDHYVK